MSSWIIPGLFGPLPRGTDLRQLPRFAKLERIMGRADLSDGPKTAIEALAEVFGTGPTAEEPVASAPLSYLGETGDEPAGWLCLAHPVILQPDQDRVLLFEPGEGVLTAHAKSDLLASFNEHFAADGLRLECPTGARFYLRASDRPAVRFSDLAEVVGRNMDPFLPAGPDQGYWRGLLNESQMLLHGLPMNEERVARGLPPIGGLWFCGGGCLPSGLQPCVRYAAGTGLILAGLCRLTGVTLCDQNAAIAQNGLIFADGPSTALVAADVSRWLTELQRLGVTFARLGAASLTIYPCDGQTYRYSPRWQNLWRRPLRLSDVLREHQVR